MSYLNSLQRLNASNENALAEYQACNPFFSQIHIPHPLTQTILDELRDPKGRQVVLTGHAGDGKSTIALEVYKKLSGIPAEQPLSQPLKPREDISGTNISIFKDLSERWREDDTVMIQELLGGQRRFLIVSNTGALLDFFRNQSAVLGVSSVQLESNVLVAIGLAYRRMYEYGTRLTLRQLTEHLAYLITSGLEESDLSEMRKKRVTPLKTEFMFFNRFFGDNGKQQHSSALQMKTVREVLRQGFGERPCPIWERKLWLKLRDRNFQLGVEDCDKEFGLLRGHGATPGNNSQPGLSPDQAREQVRRMLYFLYDFKDDQSYLMQFLNSPTILRWVSWQKSDAQLEMTEKNILEQRIYHVLQEHFTGVRLPEGSKAHDRRLYITLSRGKSEIRQTAQVVLAQVDWSNETVLQLISQQNAAGGTRIDLELQGRGRINNANLVLTLPFLDYVLMRHFGEVGETLQAAYVERLNRFKAQVQELAKETSPHVMLVRLKTDHTFRRQQYTVRNDKLEVNDVL